MTWFIRFITWAPMGIAGLVILRLLYLEIFSKLKDKTVRRALLLVIIVYFLDVLVKIIYLYFQFKRDEFGKYLLPGQGSNYFYTLIWSLSSPYIIALGIGVVLVLVLLILRQLFRAEIVSRLDLYVLILVIFVVGASNVLILILGSFFLMIFFLLGFYFKEKKLDTRARLTVLPFLLVVTLAILVLNNFTFYQNFLTLLRLI